MWLVYMLMPDWVFAWWIKRRYGVILSTGPLSEETMRRGRELADRFGW